METIFKVLIAFVVIIFVLVLLPRFLIGRQFSDKTIMQETREVYSNTRDKARRGMGLKTGTQRELARKKASFEREAKRIDRKSEREYARYKNEQKRLRRREEAFARGDKFIL